MSAFGGGTIITWPVMTRVAATGSAIGLLVALTMQDTRRQSRILEDCMAKGRSPIVVTMLIVFVAMMLLLVHIAVTMVRSDDATRR